MLRAALPIVLVLFVMPALGQAAVPVHQEPRHRLVHDGGSFRILDVQIAPGDTTLFHTHDAPIAYVSIEASPVNVQVQGGAWGNTGPSDAPLFKPGEITWNLDYANTPLTHRVTNVGHGLFRLIAVVNYGPGDLERSPPPVASGADSEGESRWFRRGRLTLAPGQRVSMNTKAGAAVAVQLTGGRIETGASAPSLTAPGSFAVLGAKAASTLRSVSPTPVTLALVDVR